jgi:hypothetical protein
VSDVSRAADIVKESYWMIGDPNLKFLKIHYFGSLHCSHEQEKPNNLDR